MIGYKLKSNAQVKAEFNISEMKINIINNFNQNDNVPLHNKIESYIARGKDILKEHVRYHLSGQKGIREYLPIKFGQTYEHLAHLRKCGAYPDKTREAVRKLPNEALHDIVKELPRFNIKNHLAHD